jgi:hypothetical protein
MSETVVVAATFILSYGVIGVYAIYLHLRRCRVDS